MSLEASPIKNLDTIVHSQPTDTYVNGTTETDFNSTLLDDVTLFSSHTVYTLIDHNDHGRNTTRNKNTTTSKGTTNTNFFFTKVNSTENL